MKNAVAAVAIVAAISTFLATAAVANGGGRTGAVFSRAPITISRATPRHDPRGPYRFFGYYGPEDAVTLESILFPDRPKRGVILEGSQ